MITTRELAELAGVSQSTVSRCLNDRPEISADTKERVRALAKEHGYILQKRHKKTICSASRRAIGILTMRSIFRDDQFINQLLCALSAVISSENYYVLQLMDFYGSSGVEQLRTLLDLRLVDGFIIINRQYDEAIDKYFQEIHIPHVYLVYYLRDTSRQANIIDTDNFTGGYLATKHLLELGHREIATITMPWDEYTERTNGYRAALEEAGIPFNTDRVLRAQTDYASCYQAVTRKSALFQQVTGLFVQMDVGAAGACNALHESGYRVPDDVSVVGLDGLDIGILCHPALTSVRQPFEDLAQNAFDRLMQIIHPSPNFSGGKILLRPKLVIRESTCPARKTPPGGAAQEPERPPA